MFGSLYTLWPFKSFEEMTIFSKINGIIIKQDLIKVYSNNNYLPIINNSLSVGNLILILSAFIVGTSIMIFFVKYSNKHNIE